MAKNVLFEIGMEELPARFINQAEADLKQKTKKWLKELRLSYENVKTYSTPRRLAIIIEGISPVQETIHEEVKGPSLKVAQAEDGNWTKAAIGFTKGQGKTTDDITIKEVNGTPYIFINKTTEGKPTEEVLPSFKKIIENLTFPQTMRWANETLRFARPIRWLVALYEDTIIPMEVANVHASNQTFGHRFLGEKEEITNPLIYKETLEKNFVIAQNHKRKQLIRDGMKKIEEKAGFHIAIDEELLDEVSNLVEYPTVFYGSFKEDFLKLPAEVLIISMKEHQRYFPVYSRAGELLPYFVSVRNGNNNGMENVIKGNEKVLYARLSDAEFFYNEDLQHSITHYQAKLKDVIFQEKIGTLYDKVKRVNYITEKLCEKLNIDPQITSKALRAAEICKFDLMTNMVHEFTELQGVIGEKYANYHKEDNDVSVAIREHYLPLQANGTLPETIVGSLVSVADKIDTISGFILVDLIPSGSQDPYGLRRQSIGMLRILKEWDWDLQVEELIDIGMDMYEPLLNLDGKAENVRDFITHRVAYLLREMDIEQDIIDAVLDKGIGHLTFTIKKAHLLSTKRSDPSFKNVQEALIRTINLAKQTDVSVNPKLFKTASESALYESFLRLNEAYQASVQKHDASEALHILSELTNPIHAFFDNNMVMAEDENIKNNRLALVSNIAALVKDYANIAVIQWNQHH